jgi:peptidyl-prolyl cis-trans isomerase SurA
MDSKNMQHTIVRQHRLVLVAMACLSLAGACGTGKPKGLAPDVWASVDGREIRREDVEKAYRRVLQPTPAPPSDDEVLAAKLSLLDELITQDILLARARELKLEVTAAELDAAFADRKRALSDEAFQQELSQRALTADDMKEGLRRELLANKVIDRDVASKILIGDQDVKDYYDKNRAQFNVPETQYHIAQIVITPVKEAQLRNRKNDDATTAVEALHKVDMLMERLRAGADFGSLAMDYSEDPQYAPQGGDIGFIPASALKQVPAQLRDVVLKSEPGNVNVVSSGGAHTIVLLIAREAAGQRDLATPGVKDSISGGLRDRKEQLLRAAYVTAARNDATIVNNLARMVVQAQGKMPSLAPSAPGK